MKNYNTYNIVVSLLIFLIISLVYVKIIKNNPNNLEGFANNNNKYDKFNETVFKNEDVITDNMWKDKNLAQCKENCNKDKNCIGFSRDKVKDDKKGGCYPIKRLGDCHSNRKGEKEKRKFAMGYDSYLKKSYKNDNFELITKCLNNQHMNTYIYMNSHLHPEHYLTIKNNNLHFIKHNGKENEFPKNRIFQLVEGLEGSGTVSFIVKDNFDENYYLSAISNKNTNYLELVTLDKNNSPSIERANASFEMMVGFADTNKLSIKKYNLTDNEPELFLILNDEEEPRIVLAFKEDIDTRTKKEMATFNIIKTNDNKTNDDKTNDDKTNDDKTNDNKTNDDKTNDDKAMKEHLKNHNNQNNINNVVSELSEQFKPTKENFVNKTVTLVDNDNNRLIIPSYYENISNASLQTLVRNLNNKYTENSIEGDDLKKFNLDNINEVLLSNPNNISCIIYNYDYTSNKKLEYPKEEKSLFNSSNIINYKNKYNNNNNNMFKIKSMKIYNYSPKKEFDDKTANVYKYDYIKEKTDNLESNFNTVDIDSKLADYSSNQKQKLIEYQNAVLKAEMELRNKKNKIESNLNKLYNDNQKYKLEKTAKQHILMNNNTIF